MDDEALEDSGDTDDAGDPLGPAPWDLDASPVERALMPGAPPPAAGVDWAEFPLRAGALLIDLAIIWVITDLIGRAINWIWNAVVIPGLADTYVMQEARDKLWPALVLILPTILMWVVVGGAAVYLWTVYRATPGQMALGLFTVDTGGRPLRRGPAAIRFAMLAIGWMLAGATSIVIQLVQLFDDDIARFVGDPLYVAFAVLPLVWFAVLSVTVLRDPRGQGWHDRIAGSVVVRRAGPPS